jgi:hypothetical protein
VILTGLRFVRQREPMTATGWLRADQSPPCRFFARASTFAINSAAVGIPVTSMPCAFIWRSISSSLRLVEAIEIVLGQQFLDEQPAARRIGLL